MNVHYRAKRLAPMFFILSASFSASAAPQVTAGIGLDYTEGDYGGSTTSSTWATPVMIKSEDGPLTLKLTVPLVHAEGVAAPGGDRRVGSSRTESGLGDLTASAFYNAFNNSAAQVAVDFGVKVKLATADHSKRLITTGEDDYSLQADAYKSFASTTVFGTLGWTLKGDPAGTDFRNPFYLSGGLSQKLNDAGAWGLSYDYRQKLTSSSAPVSEVTGFYSLRFSRQAKMQVYVVKGFKDASPDIGTGAFLTYAF